MLRAKGGFRFFRRQNSTLKTFDNQGKVPRLPIPSLQETASKYVGSLRPLLSDKELGHSEKVVADFIKEGGLGEKLQQRLVDYEKTQKNSWLEDMWFKKAYLEWREPIMINVSWWLNFKDTPSCIPFLSSPPPKGEITEVQITRAAGIISNLLNFKDALDRGDIPPETMGKKQIPLCMNQYRMQFGVTRVPQKGCDVIRQEFPATAKHIIVMIEDQIYAVNVLGEDGERVPLASIEKQLQATVELHKANADVQPAVGLLTSEHRDVWTENRETLLKLSPKNKESLEVIETSLFAVCLENYSSSAELDMAHRVIFHGHNGRNRWFDKSLSFIFMNNGRVNDQHSPSDAVIPGRIIQDILVNEPAKDPANARIVDLRVPQKLEWVVNEKVVESIEKAEERAEADIADVDSLLLHFSGYGGDKIKEVAKASPDAFLQMAFQLAYYRTYRAPCATYESASTRQFLHGRTETIRSCSTDSVAFTEGFDEDISKEEKIALLRKAIDTHTRYATDATNAKGVDRHLLGLRVMTQKGEKAEIFEDSAYMKSMNFKLSTSNVSPGDYFYGGFGPVVADGYGINYAIGKKMLKFSISSRRQAQDTCSRSFRKVLEGSLEDLMALFEDKESAKV